MFSITARVTRQLSLLFDKPLAPPNDYELDLVDQLKTRFGALAANENEISAEAEWLRFLARLTDRVLKGDPREFLRWDVIEETMFVSFAPYLRQELRFLRSRQEWNSRWSSAITESPVGRPFIYPYLRTSSGNLIHHAYHVAQFEDRTAIKTDEIDLVLELGGGYGSMCRLFHNLQFQGRYVIFDLPHFSALQEYFLRSVGVPVCDKKSFMSGATGVLLISDIDDLMEVTSLALGRSSLFIGTWSLSETPLSFREAIRPMISTFDNYLIAYQREFGELDNLEYFRNWVAKFDPGFWWDDWTIPHLPESHYLMGKHQSPGN